ncbi:hypothetical protein PISMIDRAFT_516528 [Pisolithus microcarpus 441]|uniref:Uncharacterized protein n=1 Tax=Pisolithus microcarpus 441 TaxID=765257 RepID=A0A0C9ZST7_9AGAM|nr:hypothetical protein PISMIDRAFT_516528 [Pisolithus microcarpus 441]
MVDNTAHWPPFRADFWISIIGTSRWVKWAAAQACVSHSIVRRVWAAVACPGTRW